MAMNSKLKKLKMPEAKGMDLSKMEEGSPEEEAMESPEEESMEGEELATESSEEQPALDDEQLAQLSDEQLLAEIKKRGLMSDLESQPESEMPEEELV